MEDDLKAIRVQTALIQGDVEWLKRDAQRRPILPAFLCDDFLGAYDADSEQATGH